VLTIESFLLLNPQLRKNVVYFDDESTDGTKEELESRGIRVITWLPDIKEEFLRLTKEFDSKEYLVKDYLPFRVSAINNCIYKQVKTDYLFLSDGDVVFLQNVFSDEVDKMIETKSTIVGFMQESIAAYLEGGLNKLETEYLNQLNTLGLISIRNVEGVRAAVAKRIYLNLVLMNIKELKNRGIYLDKLDKVSPYDDTGQEFYNSVIKHNISFFDIGNYYGFVFDGDCREIPNYFHSINNPRFIHLLWASSAIRRKKEKGLIWTEKFERLKKILLDDQNVKRICEKINVDPQGIYDNYLSTYL